MVLENKNLAASAEEATHELCFKYLQITHTNIPSLHFNSAIPQSWKLPAPKTKGHSIFDPSLRPFSHNCSECSALIISSCWLRTSYNTLFFFSFEMTLFLDARSGSLNFFRQRLLHHERVRRCTCTRRQLSQHESASEGSHWLSPKE